MVNFGSSQRIFTLKRTITTSRVEQILFLSRQKMVDRLGGQPLPQEVITLLGVLVLVVSPALVVTLTRTPGNSFATITPHKKVVTN